MKLQITHTNYHHYKKVFEVMWSHICKLLPLELPGKADPVAVLNDWERKSKTKARQGLKAGLQDLISQIKEFPPDLKSAIEKDLALNNLPSLRELQGVVTKTIARVLKRQQIKTIEEFYIIKEEVIDLTSDLTDENRKQLHKLLAEFELSKR